MKKENIFEVIEFSGISRERIATKLDEIKERAKKSVEPGGCFYGEKGVAIDNVVSTWFKNWLHPCLRHRTGTPDPICFNFNNRDEFKEYNLLLNKRMFENAQFNFDYTIEDIEKYIEEVLV